MNIRIEAPPSKEDIERYAPFLVELLVAENGAVRAEDVDLSYVKRLLSSGNIIVFSAWDESVLAGAALISMSHLWYNPALVYAKDLIVWTAPDYRRTGVGSALIAEIEDYARERGCSQVFLSQSTGIDTEGTQRLYKELGYDIVGFLSNKRIT